MILGPKRTLRFEALLLIAGILMIVGSLAPWKCIDGISSNALKSWHGKMAYIGSILCIFAATVKYRIYNERLLQRYRPYTDGGVGIVGSMMGLIGSFAFFDAMQLSASPCWGQYLAIVASAVCLISAIQIYQEGKPSLPKGLSERIITLR